MRSRIYMRLRIYMGVGVAVMMAACSSEDEPAGGKLDEPVAVEFTGSIDNGASRASGTSWANGDAIGITGGGYTNIRYVTATGNGNFTHNGFMIDTGGIFFQNKDDVDFTAYYPFSGSEKNSPGTITANTTEQTDKNRTGFDFLWASGTANYRNPKVALNFTHRMTKLILKILWDKDNSGISKQDFLNATFAISGVKLNGSFNTVTGVATASGSATDNWAITHDSGSEGSDYVNRTFNLILFPQSGATLTVGVAIAGQDYVCDITPALAAGNAYTYTISVKNKMLEVAGCTIADWNDGGSYEGTAGPVDYLKVHKGVQMLSNLWVATCNIGAASPEDPGLYFWWGDVVGHSLGDGFEFSTKNEAIITYYGLPQTTKAAFQQALYDNGYINSTSSRTLTSGYDAATQQWGGKWRMPTYSELQSLVRQCTWTWQDNPAGYRVKSKVSDEEIFLPLTGKIGDSDDSTSKFWESTGLFWSATAQTGGLDSNTGNADYLRINSTAHDVSTTGIPRGLTIRPVYSN